MSDSDEEDAENDALAGLSIPTFGAATGDAQDSDDEQPQQAPADEPVANQEDEEEDGEEEEDEDEEAGGTSGLLSAEQAFASDTIDSLELDPFRRAAAASIPDPEPDETQDKGKGGKSAKWVPKGHVTQRKLFVGGLSFDTTDASLLKAAARYGKIQEAVVVRTDGGKSRGFGFVTYVSYKGANYIIKEAGDPPQILIDGRQCTVRMSDEKHSATEGLHKLPARGNLPQSKPPPRERKTVGGDLPDSSYSGGIEGGIGVSAIAAAHKRAPAGEPEEQEPAGAHPKKARKKKEEIVTITRRQDAEQLDKRPITMKELFPKEFWRV